MTAPGLQRLMLVGDGEAAAEPALRALAERYLAAEGEVRGFDLVGPEAAGGRPYVALIRAAAAWPAELLIKRAAPSPRPSIPLFASLDQHLLRKCPCPVWLLRDPPGSASPPRRVVAAVDLPGPEVAEDDTDGLNRTLVVTAARLAAPGGGPLRLLHAWEDPDAGLVAQWSGAEVAERVDRSAEAARQRARAALGRLAARAEGWLREAGLEGTELRPHLVAGPARRAVPQAVAELDADLLVLGTLARTGVAGVLIGNTAEDVLNAVDCAVCAVKPPGYVSPLMG